MKSVMMNSADKIFGVHGSQRLVLDNNGQTWYQSEAHTDQEIPLDDQLGAGHLNAANAIMQFSSGEYDSNGSANVPLIGWDFGTTDNAADINKYVFDTSLTSNTIVAITLAWDRRVNFDIDGGVTNEYDEGDTWIDEIADFTFNRMYLYLLPAGAADISAAIWSSISDTDNLQHIFFQIETPGAYEFWVYQNDELIDDPEISQSYAVSWWAAEDVVPPISFGDFDGNGTVDGLDLVQWRDDFGVNDDSDADGDGDSDGADFLTWQRGLGTATIPAAGAVPEPAAWMLGVVALPLLALTRFGLCNES